MNPLRFPRLQGHPVISGAVNKEQALVIEGSRLPRDSRHAQIVQLLHETEANRPHLRRLGDKLGAWYTPVALAIAIGAVRS